MRFLIITHVLHTSKNSRYYGYGPYIREMNLWFTHVDTVEVIAPLSSTAPGAIDLAYASKPITFTRVPQIAFTSVRNCLKSIIVLPKILIRLQKAVRAADHIHLRCPGNMGLLACIVQVFFPKKIKTAKYAGNWDPESKQPLSYRIQRWILSNTFLSKNIEVLVYGKWPEQSKNIKSFFTATYHTADIIPSVKTFKWPLKALFVGTLGSNKRPLETIQFIQKLNAHGIDIFLEIFGDGPERDLIEEYCRFNDLGDRVQFRGNQPAQVVTDAYKEAHLVFLLSKSEGWPKALAEAMFWGAVPVATPVSCVPWMLDNGNRGFIIEEWGEESAITLSRKLKNIEELREMSAQAQMWSQKYTLDSFKQAIKKFL